MSSSAIDCDSMWNVWHGSKLERRLFGNKGEKQQLLSGHQGNAEATQQYADLMWRASSPQGYQPPDMHTAHVLPTDSATAGRRNVSHTSYRQHEPLRSPFQQSSRLDLFSQAAPRSNDQQHRNGSSQRFAGTDSNSADSTRPGTPPTNTGGLGSHSFAEPEYGYQQLLEPLLPTGDLLHSSGQARAQHPAQDQQRNQAARTGSFLIMPAVPAPSAPLQRPPSHHSRSPQPSEHSHGYREPSHGNLQGLNVPL